MRGIPIALSAPRRVMVDLMHFAIRVPTVPVQLRMNLSELARARHQAVPRPCWPAVFLKGYALVVNQFPELRRAYVALPWPQLYEYPSTVASITIEREYQHEPCVFFAKIANPATLPLSTIHSMIRAFAEAPLESQPMFRKMMALARLPRPLRRMLLWLGLNLPRTRPGQFGTFGLSVYSSLGAESLHPLSPLTTTLNYGVIESDGNVLVRIIYDHRVLDGAMVARALEKMQIILLGPILQELREMTPRVSRPA